MPGAYISSHTLYLFFDKTATPVVCASGCIATPFAYDIDDTCRLSKLRMCTGMVT
jgi:hypothetical protein